MSAPALPSHHVARPRLARRLAGAPVGLVEAGGGFGKSMLAAEVRRGHGTASAEALLERAVDEPGELVGALRRGLRRAGLSDAAAALSEPSPAGVADALEHGAGPVLLVVDEVQRASGAAAGFLAALARELGDRHRLLLVGRRLDPRLLALRSAIGAVHLDGEGLAFDDGELTELLGALLGVEPDGAQVAHLRRVAHGWPAASVVAALRLARDGTVPRGTLDELVEGLLDGVSDADRVRLARLGHLPLLSPAVAEAVAGPGALELLRDAGLPARAGRPGWFELADPVREVLRARAPLDLPSARAAASAYADAGELPAALALLAGDGEGVAELLASRRWQDLGALDLAELRAILSTLPEAALAAHPFGLVQTARLAERTADLDVRGELLDRALALLPDGPLRRQAEAEHVANRAVTDPGDETEATARAVLAAVAPGETVARIRALVAIGRVEAWRADPAALLRAETALAEAAALCRLAREPEWEAWTLTNLGYRVAFARGDLEVAIERMNAALALLPEPDAERAGVATFAAETLAYAGRLDDADSALREAEAIGRRLGDHRVRAYAAWTWSTLASLRLDAPATIQRIRAVERHPGVWFDHPTGAEFLADAAVALARVGERDLALEYAERAVAQGRGARVPRDRVVRDRRGRGPLRRPGARGTGAGGVRGLAPAGAARRVAHVAAARARRAAGRRSARRRAGRAGPRGGRGARPSGSARSARARRRRRTRRRRGPSRAPRDAARRLRRDRGRPHARAAAGPRCDAREAARAARGPADRARRRSRCCGRRPTARPAGGGCATCSTACARPAANS